MNPFQAQYPLSPRKFWKKFIPTIVPSLIFSILIAVVLGFLLPLLRAQSTDISSMISSAVVIAVIIFLVILGLYAWYIKTYIRTYMYEGGENFVTIKKGVFAPAEIHVQYQKIQDVYVDQDILDRIMGLYDVHIASATAGSSIEAHIDGVEVGVANGLKDFFLSKVQGASNNQGPAIAQQGNGEGVAAPAPTAVFSGDISDATYPIQPAWLAKSIIGALFSAIIFSFFISLYLFGKAIPFGLHFFPAFLIVLGAYFVLHVIGLLVWKSNYHFQFKPEFIQFNTGILSKSEQHLPYKSIQDVNASQTLLDRIFGLTNVTIENAAQVFTGKRGGMKNSGIKIVGLSKADAAELTEAVKNIALTKNSAQMGL